MLRVIGEYGHSARGRAAGLGFGAFLIELPVHLVRRPPAFRWE